MTMETSAAILIVTALALSYYLIWKRVKFLGTMMSIAAWCLVLFGSLDEVYIAISVFGILLGFTSLILDFSQTSLGRR